MDRSIALPIAESLVERLRPLCEQIVIAGSLRRGKPDVKDIEIVAQPLGAGLFRDQFDSGPVDEEIDCMTRELRFGERLVRWDTEIKRRGPRYKRFLVEPSECEEGTEIAVDLFLGDSANFGAVLAMRTGNADFSRVFMTRKRHGGFMPNTFRMFDGYLYRFGNEGDRDMRPQDTTAIRLPCPIEADFFGYLGIPTLPPSERNADGIRKLGGRL